jgi:hypothetical protein
MTDSELSSKTDIILHHASRILHENNLAGERKIGDNFSDETISRLINRDRYRTVIVRKTNETGYYMNWHYDDAQFIEHKKGVDCAKYHNQEFISDKFSIYYKHTRPIYSLIVYHSDHGVDFKGGVFEFSDGTKVYPKKNRFVLFDSRDLHRVSRVLSGTRDSTLIKFYALE